MARALRFTLRTIENIGAHVVTHTHRSLFKLPDFRRFSGFSSGTPEGIQLDPLFLWR